MKRIDKGHILILMDGTIIGCTSKELDRLKKSLSVSDVQAYYMNKRLFDQAYNDGLKAQVKLDKIRGILE